MKLTTIISTDEFILADRALGSNDFNSFSTVKKVMKVGPDVHLAFGGDHGYERPMKFYKNLVDAVKGSLRLTSTLQGNLTEAEIKMYTTCLEGYEAIIKDAIGVGEVLFININRDRYYILPSSSYKIKVLCEGIVAHYGSGGVSATTFYHLGVKPEEIVGHVSMIDDMTSEEFDIFYRKDLSLCA